MTGKRASALRIRLDLAGVSRELYRVACERAHLRVLGAAA